MTKFDKASNYHKGHTYCAKWQKNQKAHHEDGLKLSFCCGSQLSEQLNDSLKNACYQFQN